MITITVVPTKSDSFVIFCLQLPNKLVHSNCAKIDTSLVYYSGEINTHSSDLSIISIDT